MTALTLTTLVPNPIKLFMYYSISIKPNGSRHNFHCIPFRPIRQQTFLFSNCNFINTSQSIKPIKHPFPNILIKRIILPPNKTHPVTAKIQTPSHATVYTARPQSNTHTHTHKSPEIRIHTTATATALN